MKTKSVLAPAAALAVLTASIMVSLQGAEQRRLVPYWDALGGLWTVCAGITGPQVIPGKTYTDTECDQLEGEYVAKMLGATGRCIVPELEFHEAKAFGHFAYNIGTSAFCASSAARLINAGEVAEACAQITRWTFINRKDCRDPKNRCGGIVKRRNWERAVCEGKL